jgi:hypothetical protein
MEDMAMMLQQALQAKQGQGGAATSMDTMPQQEPPMGAGEGDVVQQIQEQLMAIEQALNETQDPQEMQQLIDAGRQLQEMLAEVQGEGPQGQGMPPQGPPPGPQGF